MSKRRKPARKKAKRAPKVKIKKVVLPPATVLKVELPKSVVPVVVHPTPGVVEITPVRRAKRSWWQELFGN